MPTTTDSTVTLLMFATTFLVTYVVAFWIATRLTRGVPPPTDQAAETLGKRLQYAMARAAAKRAGQVQLEGKLFDAFADKTGADIVNIYKIDKAATIEFCEAVTEGITTGGLCSPTNVGAIMAFTGWLTLQALQKLAVLCLLFRGQRSDYDQGLVLVPGSVRIAFTHDGINCDLAVHLLEDIQNGKVPLDPP